MKIKRVVWLLGSINVEYLNLRNEKSTQNQNHSFANFHQCVFVCVMKIYIGLEKSLHGLSCISIISCHGSGWCWKPAEGKTWLCCGQRIAGCDSLPFPRNVVKESWSVLWIWVALGGEQYLQDRLKGPASTNLRSDFSIYLGGHWNWIANYSPCSCLFEVGLASVWLDYPWIWGPIPPESDPCFSSSLLCLESRPCCWPQGILGLGRVLAMIWTCQEPRAAETEQISTRKTRRKMSGDSPYRSE